MFVPVRVPIDVTDLLVKISLHASADGRIKLGQIADLHVFVIPSEVEESLISFYAHSYKQKKRCFDSAQHDNQN
jgi:hypothetical protein